MGGREYLKKSFLQQWFKFPKKSNGAAESLGWGLMGLASCSTPDSDISNGTFVPNLKIDGYRCWGSTHEGDWLVFADDTSSSTASYDCFLWNPQLQSKVQLPPLLDSLPESFVKCLVSCHTIPLKRVCGRRPQAMHCRYTVYFFYKQTTQYIWCSDDFPDRWKNASYSHQDNDDLFGNPPFVDAVLFGSGFCGLTTSGLFYSPNLQMKSPTAGGFHGRRNKRRLVVHHAAGDQQDRLFLLEQGQLSRCSLQVWEVDFLRKTWVGVSNLEGIVLFLNGIQSAAYSHPALENCICFTGAWFGDAQNFYVLWLADKTFYAFKNQPHSGFPAWFPNLTSPGSPWLSFVDKDVHIIEDQAEKDVMKKPMALGSSESTCVHDNVYHQLPPDLHRLIAESLDSVMDYANLRLACRKLREAVPPMCWKPGSTTIPFPWLMLFDEKESCSCIIDPTCNMRYYYRNQELSGCKIRHSKDGWLLVNKGTRTVFFFEPFSKTKISLPNLPEGCHSIQAMSFSSSPTSSDWIIISALSRYNIRLAILRPTYDSWSFVHNEISLILPDLLSCNPVFHGHSFYFLFGKGAQLAKFSLEEEYPLLYPFNIIPVHELELVIPDLHQGYLVSCENVLCLVVIGPLGRTVNMYKMDEAASKWNQVEVMKNFSFFISETSSVAVPVSEMRTQQETINLSIFADDNRHLSYNMNTKEFRCSDDDNSRREIYERKELLNGTWIQPKLVRGFR